MKQDSKLVEGHVRYLEDHGVTRFLQNISFKEHIPVRGDNPNDKG